jgi:hypothetical protein
MRRAVFLTLLLTAAVLAAGSVQTGPTERVIPTWQHVWDGLAPVDQGQSHGTSNVVKNTEPDWALQGSGGTKTPSEFDDPAWQRPPRDWGNDVLVGAPAYKNSGRISVDNDDATGDIFVCMLNRDASEADTAHIWRSTDGGVTWQQHWNIIGTSTVGDLNDAQILCGHGPGDTTWLYVVSASSKLGLRIRRTTPDTSAFHWVTIDTTTTIVRVAMDRNIENPEHIFCFWEKSNGDIRAMSSTDAGATWANAVFVSAGRHGVSCAAGGDGYGYVAYMDTTDSTYLQIGRFNNNLVSPTWVFNHVDSNYQRRFREVAIAADRTAPGDGQVAVALSTYRYTVLNNIGPRYAWTLNGGTSWSSSFWPVTNQNRPTWLAHFPRIRRSYDSPLFRAIVSMPETTTSWDTIVYAYAYASAPDTWVGRGELNDYRNTGEASHDLGYSSTCNGGFVTYRQYGASNVWFDGYDFTGVAASPTPVPSRCVTPVLGGGANLTLANRARVTATLYDQNGRKAGELFNGMLDAGEHRLNPPQGGLARGVYFLRVAVDGRVGTAKLVRLQ